MKTLKLKSLNGKWYQGQLIINYNLLNVLKVIILAAIVALIITAGYWIIRAICWLFEQMAPVFSWIGDNWWWLLLLLAVLCLGIFFFAKLALLWMFLKRLFKTKPREKQPRKEGKKTNWLWLLLLLALLLGTLLCWRSCSGDEKQIGMPQNTQETVYYQSFDKVIIARAYLDGVQKEVSGTCPRALVGFKFINDRPVGEYDFKGLTYDESIQIVAEDWKPLVIEKLNPAIDLNEQQMAVMTLAAMRMGKAGFARSTFLQKVNEGNFDAASRWLLLQDAKQKVQKTGEEPKQYFYVLRLLWDNKIDIDSLIDMPMFSYRNLPLNMIYDEAGKHIFNDMIMERLNRGVNATPHKALELE